MEHRSKVVALALTVYSVLHLMLSSGAAEAQEKIKFPVGVGTKTVGTNMSSDRALPYTRRVRTFVAWSAILGYAFDFYNLIVLAFLLGPIQNTLNVTLPQTGLIV